MQPEKLDTISTICSLPVDALSTDNHTRVWIEWLRENKGDLKGACEKLGVTVEDGPKFFQRLKDAVLPRIARGYLPEKCPF